MIPYGETVTLLQRVVTGEDSDGNDIYTTDETDVPDCVLYPRGGSELVQDQDTVIVGLTLLAPAGTVISATDQVRARGDVWNVDGEPGLWRNPLIGETPGVQVALTKVTG